MDPARESTNDLTARIDIALRHRRLDDRERSFLQAMRAKIARDGTHLRMSPRQSRKLAEVLNRGAGPVMTFPAAGRGRPWRKPRTWKPWRRTSELRLAVMLGLLIALALFRLVPGMTEAPSNVLSAATGTQRQSSGEVSGSIRVIDGDTVDVNGEHFRLVGLNTPETFEPRCAEELRLGTRAKERLQQLLDGGTARLSKVACACPPGTEGTQRCNYGRSCGVLQVDGRDVADTLIGEGLAVDFHCGVTSCPPLPRPWCG